MHNFPVLYGRFLFYTWSYLSPHSAADIYCLMLAIRSPVFSYLPVKMLHLKDEKHLPHRAAETAQRLQGDCKK